MTDPTNPSAVLTGAEIKRLVAATLAKPAFDADGVTRDLHDQRQRNEKAELETFRLLLAQRQVIALERLADAYGKAVESSHDR